jgi:hypothetical protein
MTGRELYERHVDLSGGGQDAKDYYDRMNPAGRRGWDGLARELTTELQAARNDGVVECSEAMQDAWERREARRCPSTT